MAVTLTNISDDQISRVDSLVLAEDTDEQEFDLFPYYDTVGLTSLGIIADEVKLYFSFLPNPSASDWIQFLGSPSGDPNPWKARNNTVVNIGSRNYRKMKVVRNGKTTDGDHTMNISRVYSKAPYA